MTHEQILKQAIEKAENNGYKFYHIKPKYIQFHEDEGIWKYVASPYNYYAGLYSIIFSHDFAKAFWGDGGEGGIELPHDGYYVADAPVCVAFFGPDWKYHLQQMVLEDDPISYLAKFI